MSSSRNRFVLTSLALLTLAFLVGCGSSSTHSPVAPPSGAFSNTNFSGNYTFSVVGSDANGFALAMAGTLDACGCSAGTISGGAVDVVDPSGDDPAASIGSPSVYSISSDGRGTARLFITAGGVALPEIDMDFVLTSSSHGLITRYDDSGSGSGTIDSQASATLGANSYAFSMSGSDFLQNPLATVGAFTLDSNGNILTSGPTAGIEDFVYGFPSNTAYQGVALSGNVVDGSSTTPGIATLSSAFASNQIFDIYAIDANHAKIIEADGQYILVGDIFTSSSPAIPSGTLVFTGAGVGSLEEPFATGGTVASDGSSQLSSGLQDVNDDGTVDGGGSTVSPSSFSGSFVESPAGSGRFVLTMSNFFGGTIFAAYPSNSGILFLETDTTASAGVTSGVMLTQNSGAGIIASQGYGMNLTGLDVLNGGLQLDEIAQLTTSSTTAFSGLVDVNDGGNLATSNFAGTITPNSNGTGSVVLNNSQALAGFFYYAASTTSVPFLSSDSTIVGVGMLEGQTSPSSASADVVSRHLALMKAIPSSKKTAKARKARFATGLPLPRSK